MNLNDRWMGESHSRRACAWPRREKQGPARIIAPEEVAGWILYEDDKLLVVNKPGDVVCHPSKAGPWSSLVGALREYAKLPTVHLVFRLDRETSGVVVLAKDPETASRLQVAMQKRRIGKAYFAILFGELRAPVTVDQPLGDDVNSAVFIKSIVTPYGQPAVTRFVPISISAPAPSGARQEEIAGQKPGPADAGQRADVGRRFTLVRVVTETGRKHQIRAHAQWLGYPVVGDKIYGPDARCYLEFIDNGWTEALAAKLILPRQALHCAEIDLRQTVFPHVFTAPFPADLSAFCADHGLPPACPA